MPWKDQAEATIEGHDLLHHINGKSIQKKNATQEDQENEVVSVEYQNWKKQDALLKSWLLSSMSKPFTTHMVGCEFSHQIWKRLETFFASLITTKVRQLKNNVGNTKKEGSISDYLLEIKKIIDALISVGATVNDSDHVEAILNGFLEEYSSFITTMISRPVPIIVGELEALLMAQEELIEKYRKNDGIVQANVAQFQPQQKFNARDQQPTFQQNSRGQTLEAEMVVDLAEEVDPPIDLHFKYVEK